MNSSISGKHFPVRTRHHRNPVQSHWNAGMQRCALLTSESLLFSCLGVIKKSSFQHPLSVSCTGIVRHLKHQCTNVGWHTVKAPDFHWLIYLKEKPCLVFSLQHCGCDYYGRSFVQSVCLSFFLFPEMFRHSFSYSFLHSLFCSFFRSVTLSFIHFYCLCRKCWVQSVCLFCLPFIDFIFEVKI